MASRDKHQLNLGPMELGDPERTGSSFRKSEQASAEPVAHASVLGKSEPADVVFRDSEPDELKLAAAEAMASEILAKVFQSAGLDTKEVAFLCGVSTSLVEKWQTPGTRGCPSFLQLLLLPPRFHLELFKELNRRMGFGRMLLRAVLDDASGALALVVNE